MSPQAITEAASVVTEFFNLERSSSLLNLIVHTILPLREEDLEQWSLDPEVYHHLQISLMISNQHQIWPLKKANHSSLKLIC